MTDRAVVELAPPKKLPPEQAKLLQAHRVFMEEAYEFIAAAAQGRLTGIGRVMPYAVAIRLLQHARAMHLLVQAGYPEEAEVLARTMTVTCASLVALIDDESDGRALQFLKHSQVLRRKKIDGYVAQDMVSAEEANAWDAKLREGEEKLLADYAAHGITPAPLGDSDMYWHGIGETALFERMKADRWIDLFYRPFSEEAHGAVSTLADALHALTGRRPITLGPTFSDPRIVIGASFETIAQALDQINRHFELDRTKQVEAITSRMKDAVHEYAQSVDAGRTVQLIVPEEEESGAAAPAAE